MSSLIDSMSRYSFSQSDAISFPITALFCASSTSSYRPIQVNGQVPRHSPLGSFPTPESSRESLRECATPSCLGRKRRKIQAVLLQLLKRQERTYKIQIVKPIFSQVFHVSISFSLTKPIWLVNFATNPTLTT